MYSQDSDQRAQSTTESNFSEEESQLRFGDGQGAAPENDAIQPVADFTIWDFVRMVLVLGFVVALIYGLFYLLKRAQGNQGVQSGVVDVLASQSLPGNGMVHLVKVGNQLFMLGSSEQSLRLLTEITDKESVDQVELRATRNEASQRRGFSDLMSAMVGGFGAGAGAGEAASGEADERGGSAEPNVPPAPATEPSPREGSALRPTTRTTEPTPRPTGEVQEAGVAGVQSTAEARAQREVLDFISSQRERLRRLNS